MGRLLQISFTGEFEVCTILFSDVVTFTNICAACEPIQIVHMLNSMYSKFDRLTSIHDVYKVRWHSVKSTSYMCRLMPFLIL